MKTQLSFTPIILGWIMWSTCGASAVEQPKFFNLDALGNPSAVVEDQQLTVNRVYGISNPETKQTQYFVALAGDDLVGEKWLLKDLGLDLLKGEVQNLFVDQNGVRIPAWDLTVGTIVKGSWLTAGGSDEECFKLSNDFNSNLNGESRWVSVPTGKIPTPTILRTAKFAEQLVDRGGHIAWQYLDENDEFQVLAAKKCDVLRCFSPIEDFTPGVYQKFYPTLQGGTWMWSYLFSFQDLVNPVGGWPLAVGRTVIPASYVLHEGTSVKNGNGSNPMLRLDLLKDGDSFVSDWRLEFGTNNVNIVHAMMDVELVFTKGESTSAQGRWLAYGSGTWLNFPETEAESVAFVQNMKESGAKLTLPASVELRARPSTRTSTVIHLRPQAPLQLSPLLPANVPYTRSGTMIISQ